MPTPQMTEILGRVAVDFDALGIGCGAPSSLLSLLSIQDNLSALGARGLVEIYACHFGFAFLQQSRFKAVTALRVLNLSQETESICMCFRLSLSKFWGVHGMLKWQDQGYQSNVTLPPQAKRPPAEHEGPTAEQIEERKARLAMRKLEQQLKDALRARTTYQLSEHRILKKAFVKFDTDCSGHVDLHEFSKALEHMGLHTENQGLPGWGGVPASVMKALFDRFDGDGSGTIDYEEFLEALMTNDDEQTKMY